MIKLENWLHCYNHHVDWVLRQLRSDQLISEDNFVVEKDAYINALVIYLADLEKELFKKYYDSSRECFTASRRQWSALCHKYIKKARLAKDYISGDLIFGIWTFCDECFKSKRVLNSVVNFTRPATEEEISKAAEMFPGHHVTKILTYRNINAPISDDWCAALIMYNNEIQDFQLIWDWWYPIDRFLDLVKDWKYKE